MAESDEGKTSARKTVKKAVAKGAVQTEASDVAEAVIDGSDDRQAQLRDRLQQMGVLREPGNPGDAAKNNNTTTGAAKMGSANNKEQNKDKSFWTQILIGLAVVVSLFLFIRSIAHHVPEPMAQQVMSGSSEPAVSAQSGNAATTESVAQSAAPVPAAQPPAAEPSATEGATQEQKPANGWLGALFSGKDKEEVEENHAAEGAGASGQSTTAQQSGVPPQQAGQEQVPGWAQPRLERIDALREQIRSEMKSLQEEERKRMDEQRKADMPVWMRGHVERMESLREEMRKEMDAMHRSFREHGMDQGGPNPPMPPAQPAPAQEQVAPPGYYQGPAPWGYGYPYPPQGGNR